MRGERGPGGKEEGRGEGEGGASERGLQRGDVSWRSASSSEDVDYTGLRWVGVCLGAAVRGAWERRGRRCWRRFLETCGWGRG